jgi:hypothetical protein
MMDYASMYINIFICPLVSVLPCTFLYRMSTPDDPAVTDTEVENKLKRKSSGIGWEWRRLCDPNDGN